jgi:ion channel-forming bestrophin family protein
MNKICIDFWWHALALRGSITPHVMPNVVFVGLLSCLLCFTALVAEVHYGVKIALPVAPYEYIGAALGLLLVLRTNSGYDRWWEARKLWGGIVNQCRNLVLQGLEYGPADADWRRRLVLWTAAFPHACRHSLRSQPPGPELKNLLGAEPFARLEASTHMPSYVCLMLARLLQEAVEQHGMDRLSFAEVDRQRTQLIDHVGGCERILKTPLALAYSIKIRRFVALWILTVPFALLHSLDNWHFVPLVTMAVAYPLFSLDQLGVELQEPFNPNNLSHLALDDICLTIERNVLGFLQEREEEPATQTVAARSVRAGRSLLRESENGFRLKACGTRPMVVAGE